MKRFEYFLIAGLLAGFPVFSQDSPSDNGSTEFDKKFRFGLRITPQPTWLNSGDKNNIPNGTSFGFGFGLNMERRFSPVVALVTGVAGDFEGGKYSARYNPDPSNNYTATYWMDQSNELTKPKAGQISSKGTTVYVLRERVIKTTHITIPIIMKLSTQEYSGMKYFGMFGGELGFRVKATSNDTYEEVRRYSDEVNYTASDKGSTQTDINISGECGFPVRVGLNAGIGTEYRIAGGTSLLLSVNYFRSFVNMMDKTSSYSYYDYSGGNFKFIKQDLKLSAIRINIGIMF